MAKASAGEQRFGCPSCGGGLRYSIEKSCLICDMCGGKYSPALFREEQDQEQESSMEVTAFQCPQCGAMLAAGSTEVVSFCTFCGSDVVLTRRTAQMRRPDLIVPFKVSREECEALYRSHLSKYRFAPSGLRNQETLGHFRPVYVPFWAYDVEISGEHRFIVLKVQGDVEETRQVDVDLIFRQKDILYDASEAFEDETAARLAHDLKGAVPFNHAYLSGMYAQMPDVEADVYEGEARAGALCNCAKQVMNKLHCRELRYADQGQGEIRVTSRLVFLPVWLLAKKSGSRVLYTAVSGTSGKVVCDPPLSRVKVGLLTAGITAALFALLCLTRTIALHHLMLVTAAVMLVSVRLMAAVYRNRLFHERREGEPDFSKPQAYAGEMQARLRESLGMNADGQQIKKVKERTLGCVGYILLRLVLSIGLRGVAILIPLLIGWLTSGGAGDLALILVVILWVMSAIRCGLMVARLPSRAAEVTFILSIALVHLLAAGMVTLSIIQPVRDPVYYGFMILTLLATAGIQAMLIARQNRFATRPIPFYEEEVDVR